MLSHLNLCLSSAEEMLASWQLSRINCTGRDDSECKFIDETNFGTMFGIGKLLTIGVR